MSTAYDQAEQLLPQLSQEEKEMLYRRIRFDLNDIGSPGIVATPGICRGRPRVAGTRIAVWLLEEMRQNGRTDDQIIDEISILRPEDLTNVWAYVSHHVDEINREIAENDFDNLPN